MSPSRPENREPTVLLIEDDECARYSLLRTLVHAGYLVRTAPTGHDAVGIVRDEAAPLDVVLLDVGLPDVRGLDLCARLRELRPDLPVVVCSGEAEPQEVARLLGLGIRRYIHKPVESDELLATVRAALRLGTRALVACRRPSGSPAGGGHGVGQLREVEGGLAEGRGNRGRGRRQTPRRRRTGRGPRGGRRTPPARSTRRP
jgi:DNA-binding response OmpR family regulator